jgi:DNA replication protein DnaC
MEKGERCIFISVPKLLSKIRSTYNKRSEYSEDDLLKWLERVECLVLDDVGAEQRKTSDDGESWAVSKLFEIIDSRAGKHTIYTTNLSSGELRRSVGPRNFSRMMQDTIILKLDGEDYRLKDF